MFSLSDVWALSPAQLIIKYGSAAPSWSAGGKFFPRKTKTRNWYLKDQNHSNKYTFSLACYWIPALLFWVDLYLEDWFLQTRFLEVHHYQLNLEICLPMRMRKFFWKYLQLDCLEPWINSIEDFSGSKIDSKLIRWLRNTAETVSPFFFVWLISKVHDNIRNFINVDWQHNSFVRELFMDYCASIYNLRNHSQCRACYLFWTCLKKIWANCNTNYTIFFLRQFNG